MKKSLEEIELVATANLPSKFGNFKISAFYDKKEGKEHLAIIKGDVNGKSNVPVRLHSECLTGDVLGSLKCDCREQLINALEYIGKREHGALIYLRQEGRGIGLINKIKAYSLQDLGFDTVEANKKLGYEADLREYKAAAEIIRSLKIKSIQLMTDNPEKLNDLKKNGVEIIKRIKVTVKPNNHNKKYLDTKRNKLGHLIT